MWIFLKMFCHNLQVNVLLQFIAIFVIIAKKCTSLHTNSL